MKKIILSAMAVLSISLMTQAQINVGIKAGRNLSIQDRSDASVNQLFSSESFRGFHVGLIVEAEILPHLFLQPQLLYVKTGSKFTTKEGDWTKLTLKTIEMPVSLLYKVDTRFGKLFAGVGPVLTYGIGGKLEQNETRTKPYGHAGEYKRFDISGNALAGVEFRNGFFCSVNYQRGFRDISKTNAEVKNRSMSVSIGQTIEWKKNKRKA
jgi:hypothetical protein